MASCFTAFPPKDGASTPSPIFGGIKRARGHVSSWLYRDGYIFSPSPGLLGGIG